MVTWLQFPSNINVRYNVSIHTSIGKSHSETKEITTITQLDSHFHSRELFQTDRFLSDKSKFLVGRQLVLVFIRSRVRIATTFGSLELEGRS